LVRLIAFRFDSAFPTELAWSASLSQLATTALFSLVPSAGFFVMYAITKRYAPVLHAEQRSEALKQILDQFTEEHEKALDDLQRLSALHAPLSPERREQ